MLKTVLGGACLLSLSGGATGWARDRYPPETEVSCHTDSSYRLQPRLTKGLCQARKRCPFRCKVCRWLGWASPLPPPSQGPGTEEREVPLGLQTTKPQQNDMHLLLEDNVPCCHSLSLRPPTHTHTPLNEGLSSQGLPPPPLDWGTRAVISAS